MRCLKFIGQAEADIVEFYIISMFECADRCVQEGCLSKIGVPVLDASHDVAGESIFQTATRSPAVRRAMIVGEKGRPLKIRGRKTSERPACRSEDHQPVKRHAESSAK